MNLTALIKELQDIYEDFETAVAGYRAFGVCWAGCAFCCTTVGDVDITTLTVSRRPENQPAITKLPSYPA